MDQLIGSTFSSGSLNRGVLGYWRVLEGIGNIGVWVVGRCGQAGREGRGTSESSLVGPFWTWQVPSDVVSRSEMVELAKVLKKDRVFLLRKVNGEPHMPSD